MTTLDRTQEPDLHVDDADWSTWERERRERAAMGRAAHARELKRSAPAWVAQRVAIINAADKHGTVEYINADTVVGRCPICAQPLVIRFGPAAADLDCVGGCGEQDVAAVLFGAVAS